MSLSDPDSPERQEYRVRHRRRLNQRGRNNRRVAECCIFCGGPLNAMLQCDVCLDRVASKRSVNNKFKQLLALRDWFRGSLDIRIVPQDMQIPLTQIHQLRLQEIVDEQASQ